MPRTTNAKVRDIFSAHDEGTALPDEAVDHAITEATIFVTDRLGGEGVADATLELIETRVACHFIAASDPTEKSFTEGDIRGEFEGSDVEEMGLAETRHGRRAIALDPTGTLSSAGEDSAEWHAYGAY